MAGSPRRWGDGSLLSLLRRQIPGLQGDHRSQHASCEFHVHWADTTGRLACSMKKFLPKPSDLVLLVLAALLIAWPMLLLPLRGWGILSFASGYREVRIGMTWDEWQQLQRRHGVECVCDATDCFVDDVLRTYNVTFRKRGDEPLRIWSKRVYVHFPLYRIY